MTIWRVSLVHLRNHSGCPVPVVPRTSSFRMRALQHASRSRRAKVALGSHCGRWTAAAATIRPQGKLRSAAERCSPSILSMRSAESGIADSSAILRCACEFASDPQLKRNHAFASMSAPWSSMKSATQSEPCRRYMATVWCVLSRRSWPWIEPRNLGACSVTDGKLVAMSRRSVMVGPPLGKWFAAGTGAQLSGSSLLAIRP